MNVIPPEIHNSMFKIILFIILSIPVIIISWRSLFSLKSHGFYRFVSWECIIWLFTSNYPFWFEDPLSLQQIFSWIFLLASAYTIIAGVITLKRKGKAGKDRDDSNLYTFEKTSELVDTGIYKYIRHPLYASLLYLTWGICLKNPTLVLLLVSVASSVSLLITALFDEKECTEVFGEEYREYMKRSKRFVPFVF
jgi:protein-S-isoprenylcysteine O-methyltransferase Ste14